MKSPVLLMMLVLLSPMVQADDHIVDFDQQVDFSGIRTFAVRDTAVRFNRAELRNPLVVKQISDMVRSELTSRGLKEVSGNPDVIVESTLGGQGFALGLAGRAWPIDEERAARGGPNPGAVPESFLEGLLVVDITLQSSNLLIWRGVYRDKEPSAAKLALRLPGDVKKLLAAYPPKKK